MLWSSSLAVGMALKWVEDLIPRRSIACLSYWTGYKAMFGFGPATRIYVAAGATDMRKSFNGLYGLVRDQLGCDPESGHVFLFTNARRNRLSFWSTTEADFGCVRKSWTAGHFAGQPKTVLRRKSC